MIASLVDFYHLPIKPHVLKDVVYIDKKKSVHQAMEMMSEKRIGCLLVKDPDGFYGIVTERDVVHEYAMELYDLHEKPVGDIMTVKPVTININDCIGKAFELMAQYKFRHLPVEDNKVLVGILSIKDLVRIFVENLPAKKS